MRTVLYLDMWIGERIQEMKLAGIRRFAHMAGWEVIPVGEAESRPSKLKKLLKKHQPDGVIVECSASRKDLPPHRFGSIPVVYLDCSRSLYGPAVARVVHDGKATTRAVFRELAANRPSAYAVVGYAHRCTWSTLRKRAFVALVSEAGGTCLIFPFRAESPAARAARLADWVGALPRKTAVFAVNDQTAFEVIEAARAAHRAIPREITLAGVDNLVEECTAASPQLTSVQVDSEMAGYRAAALLDDQIKGRGREGSLVTYGPTHDRAAGVDARIRTARAQHPVSNGTYSPRGVHRADGCGCRTEHQRVSAACRFALPRSIRPLDS
jgi:DNA-binding LacI/PurR family transcriptional regulator